jgi:hypothetical protein
MFFDPSETYIHLTLSGSAERLPGGERFWSMPEPELDRFGHGWLVTEFECSSDWSNWEMHPDGDEFVYLLSGEAVLLLKQPAGLTEVPLSGRALSWFPGVSGTPPRSVSLVACSSSPWVTALSTDLPSR